MLTCSAIGCGDASIAETPAHEDVGTVSQRDETSARSASLDAPKAIGDIAGALSNYYTVVQAAVALLQALGYLNSQDQTAQLQALMQQVTSGTSTTIWFEAEKDREARLSTLLIDIATIHDRLNAGLPVDWGSYDRNEADIVNSGGNTTAFELYAASSPPRFFDAPLSDPDRFGSLVYWPEVVHFAPADAQPSQVGLFDTGGGDCPNCGGTVFDWRLGLPAFMQLIALRIQVMGMEDANFTKDRRFHDELTVYHDRLVTILRAMNNGIRCNTQAVELVPGALDHEVVLGPEVDLRTFNPCPTSTSCSPIRYHIGCADIFSGLHEMHNLRFDCLVGDCPQVQDDQAFAAWYDANITPIQKAARIDVLNMTPWFSVQVLIDTLSRYANGTSALDAGPSIFLNADNSLCIDTLFSLDGPPFVTPLSSCPNATGGQASPSQAWTYNSLRQRVINRSDPGSSFAGGLCLTAMPTTDNPAAQGDVVVAAPCDDQPGDPVNGVAAQLGSPAQRWSYDPTSFVLGNGISTVLDVPNGNFRPGQILQTNPRNASASQQWVDNGNN